MFTPQEKRVLGLMFAVQVCLMTDFMMLMPLGPQLMRVLEIDARQFSGFVGAYMLSAGFIGLVVAPFMDRFDRKALLLGSFALFFFSQLGCALADSYGALLVARCGAGATAGVTGSLLYSIVSDSVSIDKRATSFGLVMAAFAPASMISVPLGLTLGNRFGWHTCYFYSGVLALAVLALQIPALPRFRAHLETAGAGRGSGVRLDRDRILSLAFVVALILGHFSLIPFLFPSFVNNAGVSETKLPVVYLVGGAASVLASVLFGRLSDRVGRKRVFSACLLLSLAAILWVTRLGPSSVATVSLAAAAFFAFMGGRLTPALALVTDTVPIENRGSFLSLVGSVQQLASALGAFVAGLLVVKTPSGMLEGYPVVGWFAIGASIVALVLVQRIPTVRETRSA